MQLHMHLCACVSSCMCVDVRTPVLSVCTYLSCIYVNAYVFFCVCVCVCTVSVFVSFCVSMSKFQCLCEFLCVPLYVHLCCVCVWSLCLGFCGSQCLCVCDYMCLCEFLCMSALG